MTASSGPHLLTQAPFIMAPDGRGHVKPWGPSFYEELDQQFDGFRGHVLVTTFAFSEPWDTWEVHPEGDELVYLLSGSADFVLRQGGADHILTVREPGSYVVVPKNTWHTARPHEPTQMLFITPGEGTLNAAQPDDNRA